MKLSASDLIEQIRLELRDAVAFRRLIRASSLAIPFALEAEIGACTLQIGSIRNREYRHSRCNATVHKWLSYMTALLCIFILAERATADQASGRVLDMRRLQCPADQIMHQVELIFGMKKADGTIISDNDWNSFLENEITPRFPDGLTVIGAYGQWRNAAGAIRKEPSRIVMILYPPANKAEQHVEAIRSLFKARFQQESVMRIDAASCVRF